MRNTFSINFYCRKSKASKKTGEAPVEMSIIINGERTFIQLPMKTNPLEFGKKRNPQIEEYLDEARYKARQTTIEMTRNGIRLTADNFKKVFSQGGVEIYTVEDLCNEYLELLHKRVGVNLTVKAYNKYKDAVKCLYKHLDKGKDAAAVTPGDMESFFYDMNAIYKPSTANGICTKLKTIFTYARDNGIININPFVNIRYNKVEPDIKYLTEEELRRIQTCEIDNKSLSDVRDAFVLQAATGLSYADIYALTKDDIQLEGEVYYIAKKRRKTGTAFTTVVLPPGVEVLRRHNWQLRIISNQKYNTMLKTIQVLAGIETNLTTHLARKTFATHLLNSGVRIETVAAALGHKHTTITATYYSKLKQETVLKEIGGII